jgi:PKD repeat protein
MRFPSQLPTTALRIARFAAGGGLLLVTALTLGVCSSSNPVAPTDDNPGAGDPPGGATFTLTLTVPPQLETGGNSTVQVTVSVQPSGVQLSGREVTLITDLGYFALDPKGEPIQQTAVVLNAEGNASTTFFAGEEAGTANLLAQIERTTQSAQVAIVETRFFVSAVVPSVGSAAGGDTVQVQGRGFVEPVRVAFGSAVAQVSEFTATALTVVTPAPSPPLAAGETRQVDVQVTNDLSSANPPVDTLPGGFTYTPGGGPVQQPVIFSLDPTQGPNEGELQVTILGDGFAADAQVFFGLSTSGSFQGVEGTAVQVAADGKSLVVNRPPATGAALFLLNQTADVQVKNPDTGLFAIASGAFRYGGDTGVLFVSSLSPRQGSANGGVPMTLRGQGFGTDASAIELELAGVIQDSLGTVTATQILWTLAAAPVSGCAAPMGPARVTNLSTGESAASEAVFTYTVDPPLIGGVEGPGGDASGTSDGGETVTVSGTGFTGATEVTFDGVRAAVTSVSDTEIQATTPAFTGTLPQEACDDNGDGVEGTRALPAAVDVAVTRSDGCSDTLVHGFTYNPADTTCDEAPAEPLRANFTYMVNGLSVAFQDTSTGNPTLFQWDFGDGASSGERNPVHVYAAAGMYTVTLTVQAGITQDSISMVVTVP